MSENETAALAETDQEPTFDYPVTIEDVGPGAKKVSVEVPAERIAEKLEEQFKDLRKQAQLPGFRPGHAPRKLIEKRFNTDVREQVRSELIRESYEQVLEKNKLKVLGEPEFENPDAIKLPETGNLSYSFQVEVQPEFTLPALSGVKVRKPTIAIKDENVEQAMSNLREQQGVLAPVEGRPVEEKDYLTADVHLKVDGNVVAHQHDAQLVARPGRIAGIQVDDLDKQLAGLNVGETRTLNVKGPETHANEAVRGKDVQIEVALKDLKRLELAEITPEFLAELGFDNEVDLRAALREQMEEKINFDVQQAMREQVNKYLLDNVTLEVPAKLSERQASQVVQRRAVDLLQRGIGREQLEQNIERLRGGAEEEARRELKLYFILQKVAEETGVAVDEGELNGRVAMIAAQRGQRPEKLKQEMLKDGSLTNLYVQLLEQKAVDKILETAEVEEFDAQQPQQAGAESTAT